MDTKDKDDPRVFLEDITAFETSPTRYPANRWLSVFQKSSADPREMNMLTQTAREWLAKSDDLSEAARAACKTALDALDKAKGEFSEDKFKAFQKMLGHEQKAEGDDDKAVEDAVKEAEEKAEEHAKSVRALVAKSVAHLDAAEPDARAALDVLAPVIGHKPVHQVLAELPAHARQQIEELKKSADANAAELAEFRKSQAKAAKDATRREMVAKAAALPNVPMGTADLGELLATVQDASPAAGEGLVKLLTSVEALVGKSAILGRGHGSQLPPATPGGKGAEAEIDALAEKMVQKSAADGKPMTPNAAWLAVMEARPDLANRYDAEKTARTVGTVQ